MPCAKTSKHSKGQLMQEASKLLYEGFREACASCLQIAEALIDSCLLSSKMRMSIAISRSDVQIHEASCDRLHLRPIALLLHGVLVLADLWYFVFTPRCTIPSVPCRVNFMVTLHKIYTMKLGESPEKLDTLCDMQGYNAAIIAYGQTGTGKTFTMEGGSDATSQGIIPRAIEDMFSSIEHDCTARSKYLVRASYLQIYNEV